MVVSGFLVVNVGRGIRVRVITKGPEGGL
jgi:hypothetical protein